MELIDKIKEKIGHGKKLIPNSTMVIELQPVCCSDHIRSVEKELDFQLPNLIKKIYCEVGNGGFGPGYGILGFGGGWTVCDGETADFLYKQFRMPDEEDPSWQWPDKLLPYCYWGCTLYSCLDCRKNLIVNCDTSWRSIGDPMENIFLEKKFSIEEWFEMWIEDKDVWIGE